MVKTHLCLVDSVKIVLPDRLLRSNFDECQKGGVCKSTI